MYVDKSYFVIFLLIFFVKIAARRLKTKTNHTKYQQLNNVAQYLSKI